MNLKDKIIFGICIGGNLLNMTMGAIKFVMSPPDNLIDGFIGVNNILLSSGFTFMMIDFVKSKLAEENSVKPVAQKEQSIITLTNTKTNLFKSTVTTTISSQGMTENGLKMALSV